MKKQVIMAFRYAALCAAIVVTPLAASTAADAAAAKTTASARASAPSDPFAWSGTSKNKLAKARGRTDVVPDLKKKRLDWHITGKIWDLDSGSKCALIQFAPTLQSPKGKLAPVKSIKKCGKGAKKIDFWLRGVSTLYTRICQVGKDLKHPTGCTKKTGFDR